jgi:hypothetical protein
LASQTQNFLAGDRDLAVENPAAGNGIFGCRDGRLKSAEETASVTGDRKSGRSPGTEFLDAETRRQKSRPKSVNAGRDQNPGSEWPEIPAEAPYLASYRKRAVCGDWMVVCTVICEPVSIAGTGNFLKISGQSRLSEGYSLLAIANSPVIQISYAAVQALSCYFAKQAFEARQQAIRCSTSGFLNLRPGTTRARHLAGGTNNSARVLRLFLLLAMRNREEETFA